MKILSLRLIVALIIGVTLVSLASSWYEVRTTKDALRRDLESKAETLGQSLAAGAEVPLQAEDTARLELMVRRSTNHDHLLGIGIYGSDGVPLVVGEAGRPPRRAVDVPPGQAVVATTAAIGRAFPQAPSPAEVVVTGPGATGHRVLVNRPLSRQC